MNVNISKYVKRRQEQSDRLVSEKASKTAKGLHRSPRAADDQNRFAHQVRRLKAQRSGPCHRIPAHLQDPDAAITALCKKTGIHRAHGTEEFANPCCAHLASVHSFRAKSPSSPTPADRASTDAAEREGSLCIILPKTGETEKLLPVAASIKTRIDVLGDSDATVIKPVPKSVSAMKIWMAFACSLYAKIMTPQTMLPNDHPTQKICAARTRSQ